MARMHNIHTGAVIDIKGIADCNVYELDGSDLVIGSGLTLTNIAQKNLFPLLSSTVERIADHTIQGKITLGGNIAGSIIYREAILPLLVADSAVVIANKKGQRMLALNNVFKKAIQLQNEDLIVRFVINKSFLALPYFHIKRTKNEKIDYPLITISGLVDNDRIKVGFSGLHNYPFRSKSIEDILNNDSYSKDIKIKKVIDDVSDEILNDISGSAEYRKFMLGIMLDEILINFGEEK